MAYELTEQKKIGFGFIGFDSFFLFLGVILFFDRGLLALGNIFFLAGVALLLGWHSTLQLFTNRANYKGSVCFLLGLFFIFVRWPIVGIIFEIYACVVLFGGFWSSVKVFLYQIPVIGWILQYPGMQEGKFSFSSNVLEIPSSRGTNNPLSDVHFLIVRGVRVDLLFMLYNFSSDTRRDYTLLTILCILNAAIFWFDGWGMIQFKLNQAELKKKKRSHKRRGH